jgi:hypothetical protein
LKVTLKDLAEKGFIPSSVLFTGEGAVLINTIKILSFHIFDIFDFSNERLRLDFRKISWERILSRSCMPQNVSLTL